MKKHQHRVPKTLLVKLLAILGYKLDRGTLVDRRMWRVAGHGKTEYFPSLMDVFKAYRKAPTNDLQIKIDPYVDTINRAIF